MILGSLQSEHFSVEGIDSSGNQNRLLTYFVTDLCTGLFNESLKYRSQLYRNEIRRKESTDCVQPCFPSTTEL